MLHIMYSSSGNFIFAILVNGFKENNLYVCYYFEFREVI